MQENLPWGYPRPVTEYSEEMVRSCLPKAGLLSQAVFALGLPSGPAKTLSGPCFTESHSAPPTIILDLLSQVSDLHGGPEASLPTDAPFPFNSSQELPPANLLHIC